MEKISIHEIEGILVEKGGLTKAEASDFVVAMFDVVQEGLERDNLVKIKGLGTFKIIDIEPRASVNVNTGERVVIEGHGKISFTPDAAMKELVNKPFSQFDTVILNDGVDFGGTVPVTPAEDAPELRIPIDDSPVTIPLVDIPRAEEPASVEEKLEPESVVEEPAPVFEPEPFVEEPIVEEPIVEEPIVEEPIVEEPIIEEPIIEEPIIEQPVIENPVIEEPVVENPVMEEPVFEEPLIVEPEPIQEPEPVVEEPVPVIEDEPLVEEPVEDEPSVEEEPPVEEEPLDNDYTYEYNTPSERHWGKWAMLGLLFLGILAVACYFSYEYGKREGMAIEHRAMSQVYEEPGDSLAPIAADSVAEVPADTVSAAPKATEETPAKKEVAAPEPPVKEVKSEEPAAAPTVDPDKYAQMDIRVRTGAYRIVGDDRVVTARAGETVSHLAKRTLGEGMSCYIEVYNDLKGNTELQEGQKVKIPKLQLKKKVAK